MCKKKKPTKAIVETSNSKVRDKEERRNERRRCNYGIYKSTGQVAFYGKYGKKERDNLVNNINIYIYIDTRRVQTSWVSVSRVQK